jgi:hypothetical protein
VANLCLDQQPRTTNSPATKSVPKTTLLCWANQFGRSISKLLARSLVNRAAKSDSGHLPPLSASTPHSSRTSPVRIAAQRNRRMIPMTGKAKDARRQKRPNQRVQELDRRQHLHSPLACALTQAGAQEHGKALVEMHPEKRQLRKANNRLGTRFRRKSLPDH